MNGVAAAALALTAGCSLYDPFWPAEGRNGFAEHSVRLNTLPGGARLSLAGRDHRADMVAKRLTLAGATIAIFSQTPGARGSAMLRTAEMTLVRAHRELHGGLVDDADRTADRLLADLELLRNQQRDQIVPASAVASERPSPPEIVQ
ncbi:MAG: hypothetical protein JNK11_07930 [Alphaproteobacteria bacterium]|nr:hypothetical protein [Alphaproteobacteria bacterium]